MLNQTITIHSNYPGGNIKVVEINNNTVRLEQDIRDTTQWWFYWNFCIEGATEEIEFVFTNGEVIGPWGPAVSKDGVAWDWAGEDSLINRQSFKYKFSKADKRTYFCFSLPYVVRDFENFYFKYKDHAFLQREVLTISEQGRDIPLLIIGNPASEKHILLTCRHHACESTASYLLEGMLSYILENKEHSILQNYAIHVIPFVDIDGVENGDQGKARAPYDHNRDYTESPIYQSTAAIMAYVKRLRPEIGIDFHCPYKWDERNDFPFFVNRFSPVKEEIDKLGVILSNITGKNPHVSKILYDPIHDIEMGEDWNQPGMPTICSFLCEMDTKLSCTFEFPYFGTGNTVYTQENNRQFGVEFAKALEIYLVETRGKLI